MNKMLSYARILQDEILEEFNSRRAISCSIETNTIGSVSVKVSRFDWVDDIHGYKFRNEILFHDYSEKTWDEFLKDVENLKAMNYDD